MSEESKGRTIPYASFISVSNFLERLSGLDTPPPDHIDRSMLSSMSGSNQTALIGSLEFLGLIAPGTGKTQPHLEALVEARKRGETEWREALLAVLEEAYSGVVGDLNVQTTTPGKLEEAFRNAGMTAPGMLEKAIRFYVKALQAAGVRLPEHLQKTKRRTTRKVRSTPKTPRSPARSSEKEKTPPEPEPRTDVSRDAQGGRKSAVPSGFARQEIPTIDGAYIVYPVNMTETDFALFEAALQFMRAVVQKGAQQ